MLEALTAVSLLLLIITHFFLVRGCFSIKAELPVQGGILAGRLDRTADLLDEVAQLIADLGDGAPSQSPALAQTGSPVGDLLTMFLNNRMNMGGVDSHAEKEQEWEIYPPTNDPTTTNEASPQTE